MPTDLHQTIHVSLAFKSKHDNAEYVTFHPRHVISLELMTQEIIKPERIEFVGPTDDLFVRGLVFDCCSLFDHVRHGYGEVLPLEYGDVKLPASRLDQIMKQVRLPVVKIGRYIRIDLMNEGPEKTILTLLNGEAIR